MSIIEKLRERAADEKTKTSEDVEWLMEQEPEVANKAMKFMRTSLAFKLGLSMTAIASIYFLVTSLTFYQLIGLSYLLVGLLLVKVSDYKISDLETYITPILWLPIVIYSFLPDSWRLEK